MGRALPLFMLMKASCSLINQSWQGVKKFSYFARFLLSGNLWPCYGESLYLACFNYLQVFEMSLPVMAVFALGTGIELYGLKYMSDAISILNTVSLIMFTFLVGIVVSRSYGKEVFEKMQRQLKSREAPSDKALNGAVMGVASMFLITPGVVTDMVGLLIMIPLTRGFFKKIALDITRDRIQSGQPYFFFKD